MGSRTRLLSRYLILEFLAPFFFSLLLMSSIMITGFVLFNLMEQSVQYQIPFELALKIFINRIPEMLYYTLPMASLLGSMLAFSRLSGDGELLSLRMLGLSFYQILSPLALSGLVLAIATLLMGETFMPSSIYQARQLLNFAQTHRLEISSQQAHLVYRELKDHQLHYLLYAAQAEKNHLFRVALLIFEKDKAQALLEAEEASFNSQSGDWTFLVGEMKEWPSSGVYRSLKFKQMSYTFQPSLKSVLEHSRQPMEMNLNELSETIQNMKTAGQNSLPLAVRWHQKIALPVTSLLFLLLGAALGARTLSSKMQGFGLSLLIIFVYYLFFSAGTALGDSGQISACLGAWGANGLLLIITVYLVWFRNKWG